jgi:hypothetical protein
MEIYTLYHNCLTESDKRHLAFLLKKEKIKASNELLVRDWMDTEKMSIRLRNALLRNFCDNDIYPSEITAKMFMMHRHTGIKTWKEFQEVRGDNL